MVRTYRSTISKGRDPVEVAMRLCKSVAGKMSHRLPPWWDFDDLASIAIVSVLEYLPTLDPKRKGFTSMIYKRAHGAIIDHMRSVDYSGTIRRYKNTGKTLKAWQEVYINPIDQSDMIAIDEHAGDELTPEELALSRERFDWLMREAKPMGRFRCEVLKMYLFGMTQRAIGEKLGLSEARINQYLMSMERKLAKKYRESEHGNQAS
jgi:RNA polymerase sigma factor (sigma-70 family)